MGVHGVADIWQWQLFVALREGKDRDTRTLVRAEAGRRIDILRGDREPDVLVIAPW